MTREAPRIEDRLARTVGPDRIHGMGCVAQKRRPAERPARQRISIAVGILVEVGGGFDDPGRIDEIQAEPVPHEGQHLGRDTRPAQFSERRGDEPASPVLAITAQLVRRMADCPDSIPIG